MDEKKEIFEILKNLGNEKDKENDEIGENIKYIDNFGEKSNEIKDDKLNLAKTEYTTKKTIKKEKKLKIKSNEKTFVGKKRKNK